MDMASHMVCFGGVGGVLGCLFYFGCMGQLKSTKFLLVLLS